MKKLLFLLAFLPVVAMAEVSLDETDPKNGNHFVMGIGGEVDDWHPIQLVCAQMKDGDRVWNLRITINSDKAIQIQKNQQLRLTFSDDTYMVLNNMREIGPDDHKTIPIKKGKKNLYQVTPEYPMTKAQVMEIMSKNAQLGQIYVDGGEINHVVIKGNRFSGNIKDQYFSILSKLREYEPKPEAEQRFLFEGDKDHRTGPERR